MFGKVTGICGIFMAVVSREGPERTVSCPVDAWGAFDVALMVTDTGAPFCASLSAFFLALQFCLECLPFLQNVQLYSAVTDTTVQHLVP